MWPLRRMKSMFVRLTISTDGIRDFIEVPGGVKYTLGYIPASKAVSMLAAGGREARQALDAFLERGEGSFMGDPQRIELLFSRRPPVLAKALISRTDRIPIARERTTMAGNDDAMKAAIAAQVDNIERQIALISAKAKEASPGSITDGVLKDEVQKLRDLISWLRRPSPYGDQAKNDTFYGLGKGLTAAEQEQQAEEQEGQKQASTTLKANTVTAKHILSTVEATNETIDRLVTAGKKFNSVKAKLDLHRIASQVQNIVSTVDLSVPWVGNDLTDLSKRADEINGLFPKNA